MLPVCVQNLPHSTVNRPMFHFMPNSKQGNREASVPVWTGPASSVTGTRPKHSVFLFQWLRRTLTLDQCQTVKPGFYSLTALTNEGQTNFTLDVSTYYLTQMDFTSMNSFKHNLTQFLSDCIVHLQRLTDFVWTASFFWNLYWTLNIMTDWSFLLLDPTFICTPFYIFVFIWSICEILLYCNVISICYFGAKHQRLSLIWWIMALCLSHRHGSLGELYIIVINVIINTCQVFVSKSITTVTCLISQEAIRLVYRNAIKSSHGSSAKIIKLLYVFPFSKNVSCHSKYIDVTTWTCGTTVGITGRCHCDMMQSLNDISVSQEQFETFY